MASVDVFRGATIVAMILVNAQFSPQDSYPQFVHSAWHGWTFADTIFPAFLLLVGVSLTLSTESRVNRGEDRRRLLGHALGRSALLFICGVTIDYLRVPTRGFPFIGLQPHLQLTGALQMIAICYLLAFLIYLWAKIPGAIVGIVALNVLYLGLLYFYPVPGCGAGSLEVDCNFPGYFNEAVIDGFRWNSPAFDPNGIGVLTPGTTSVLFGVLAGQAIRRESRPVQRGLWLFCGGVILVVLGLALSAWVPINKQLWTTSYAVFMAGLAAVGLACSTLLVDGRPLPGWLRPLQIFGLNAIAAYLISRLVANIPRVHVLGRSLYEDVLLRIASPPNASLLFAMMVLGVVYLAVWLMDRRGWRVKL